MKLISWNVNGRKGGVAEQAAALAGRAPEIVALQEVRAGSVERWADELTGMGLPHIVTTQDRLTDGRRNFVLAGSRFPLDEDVEQITVPLPELMLSVAVRRAEHPFELVVAHIPNAQGYRWKKVEHLESLYAHLSAHATTRPFLVCGDFNCPRREFADGTLFTWAQRETGEMRSSRGERWDSAERNVIRGMVEFGLVDLHHGLNGFTEEGSWVPAHAPNRPRRFDHVFASTTLKPERCRFIHEWRTVPARLSDHSAIEAVFAG